jgi:hypothetical protein
MAKIGDTEVKGGIKTTITNIDPKRVKLLGTLIIQLIIKNYLKILLT